MMGPADLLWRWLPIDATSGREGAFASEVEAALRELGLDVERQEVAPGRWNLWARKGEPRVVYCTHLDTVPPHLEPRREGTRMFGRGACDAKGIVAAMTCAAASLCVDGERGFALLFVVGEETDHCGAVAARALLDGRTRWLVVGEPTGNRFASGQKGALKCTVRFSGVACHSAYPEHGRSAIHALLRDLAGLDSLEWGRDPVLGAGTLNIGVLRGGLAHNVLAPSAEADLLFRLVEPADSTLERLRGRLGPDPDIEVLISNDPVRLDVPDGETGTPVAFNTDVPYLTGPWRALLAGPGSILDAHTSGEQIDEAELDRAVALYLDLFTRLDP